MTNRQKCRGLLENKEIQSGVKLAVFTLTLKVASNLLTKEYVELLKLLEGDPGNNEHKIIHYANLSIVETAKKSKLLFQLE